MMSKYIKQHLAQFIENLSNTESEFKKVLLIKKVVDQSVSLIKRAHPQYHKSVNKENVKNTNNSLKRNPPTPT